LIYEFKVGLTIGLKRGTHIILSNIFFVIIFLCGLTISHVLAIKNGKKNKDKNTHP
jgi:hypothetical protein